MNPELLFENKNYIVLNKPSGLVVHADGRTKEEVLTDWVAKHFPDVKGVGEPLTLSSGEVIERHGIVHRIDRDTSGAIVIARTQEAFLFLKTQFQNREVTKRYHVFVYGDVKKEEDVIDRPIGRSKKDFRLWSAQRFAKGELREAITEYNVLARGSGRAGSVLAEHKVTFLEARPRTGRTHQIRVHLKAINHPVVSDPLYAPKRDSMLGLKRLALHARSISFHDMDGKEITVVAPYPADFEAAVKKIGYKG